MAETQQITGQGMTDEQLSDAEEILLLLDEGYGDEPMAVVNILMTCLAGVLDSMNGRKASVALDNGAEVSVTYSPGRAPEEKLH